MQINELNSNELFITYCNLKDLKGINFDDFVSADDEISTKIVKSDIEIISSNTHIIVEEEEILDLIEHQPKP